MKTRELRTEISKIFIRWGLGTRQIAIIEIANLVEKEVDNRMAEKSKQKKEKKKAKKKTSK